MHLERSGDSAVADVNSRGRLVALEFFCEAFVFCVDLVNLENNKKLSKHSTGFRLFKL